MTGTMGRGGAYAQTPPSCGPAE